MSGFKSFLRSIATELESPNEHDEILECGCASLETLKTKPAESLQLANDKLHVFPFKDVKTCWRRLYTDARILLAIEAAEHGQAPGVSDSKNRSQTPVTTTHDGTSFNALSRGGHQVQSKDGSPLPRNVAKRTSDQISGSPADPGRSTGDKSSSSPSKRLRTDDQDWLSTCVEHLDMALIVAGGCMREDMIETFFSYLREECQTDGDSADLPLSFLDAGTQAPTIEHPVARHRNLSLSEFEAHLKGLPLEPLLIEKAMEGWEALRSRPWSRPSYLLSCTLGGRRLVPIELGRSYTDDDWGQTIVRFKQFLGQYILQSDAEAQSVKQEGTVAEESTSSHQIGLAYLAQHDLFMQMPALRNDICIPDYCYTDPPPPVQGTSLAQKYTLGEIVKIEEPQLNAWFGPAGTISPLHTDPYHNILCQVVGQKYVRLYSPAETERLKPRGKENGIDMSNTSSVPTEVVEMGSMVADDPEEWAEFEEAKYYETILSAGECLYIPVGWWHYVRSLTVSFSVSFWWN